MKVEIQFHCRKRKFTQQYMKAGYTKWFTVKIAKMDFQCLSINPQQIWTMVHLILRFLTLIRISCKILMWKIMYFCQVGTTLNVFTFWMHSSFTKCTTFNFRGRRICSLDLTTNSENTDSEFSPIFNQSDCFWRKKQTRFVKLSNFARK